METADRLIHGVARLTTALPAGMVAVTALFGQLAVELENSQQHDAMANTPGLDMAPARIIKLDEG